jgi:nitrogen fixation-related uncharacterized protein
MGWTVYILVFMGVAALFFIAASYALHWAHRHKQLENFEEGARSIFDEDEPEGEITDAFPPPRSRKPDDSE